MFVKIVCENMTKEIIWWRDANQFAPLVHMLNICIFYLHFFIFRTNKFAPLVHVSKFSAQIYWVLWKQIFGMYSNSKYFCYMSTLFAVSGSIFVPNVNECAFMPNFLFVPGKISQVANRTNQWCYLLNFMLSLTNFVYINSCKGTFTLNPRIIFNLCETKYHYPIGLT